MASLKTQFEQAVKDSKQLDKFDAWTAQQGKAKDAAMQQYIDLIESLK